MTPVADLTTTLTRERFQELYVANAGPLRSYLIRCLHGDVAEAEGITQEAFLKAWEKRDSLQSLPAFRSWLYSIALNVLRQRKRRLQPLAVAEVHATCEAPSPEQHLQATQELDRVLVALEQLPEEQREALLLVRMEQMKFREAAEVLGISENTVKTRVRRGLLKLAECLDPGLA